jgi:hypothetical protein
LRIIEDKAKDKMKEKDVIIKEMKKSLEASEKALEETGAKLQPCTGTILTREYFSSLT